MVVGEINKTNKKPKTKINRTKNCTEMFTNILSQLLHHIKDYVEEKFNHQSH